MQMQLYKSWLQATSKLLNFYIIIHKKMLFRDIKAHLSTWQLLQIRTTLHAGKTNQ